METNKTNGEIHMESLLKIVKISASKKVGELLKYPFELNNISELKSNILLQKETKNVIDFLNILYFRLK
jgi:hypothetical protein